MLLHILQPSFTLQSSRVCHNALFTKTFRCNDSRFCRYKTFLHPATLQTRATRRLSLSIAGITALLGRDPRALIENGMAKFRKGEIGGSLADFNKLYEQNPSMRSYLWQRGLSLYYLGQFEDGAKQFREDVAVNPNDSEEAIWAFMCEAKTLGVKKAQEAFLQVGRDSRPVLRAALECFKSGADPEKILDAAASRDGGGEHFYALLYVGLWNEAYGYPEKAEDSMVQATTTDYCQNSSDYMASLARVHCAQRGWVAQVGPIF